MARVSSRYNYRLSKNSKATQKTPKRLVPPDEIVIRNKKTESKKVIKASQKEDKIINKAKPRVVRRNKIVAVNKSKKLDGKISLSHLKDYCSGKRVILIGNSSEIIKNEYGKQIDDYDIVIRMNHGHPVKRYAANMGKKYNIWAHGFLSFKQQIKEYNNIKKNIDFHIETNEDKLCRKIFDNKAFMIPKKWYKNDYEKRYNRKEMSTGLNIATFFVNWVGTMKEISIVGFDFLKTSNPVLKSARARKFHDSDAEKSEMSMMLSKSGFYVPFHKNYIFEK